MRYLEKGVEKASGMVSQGKLKTILEEEALIIRHSGEIPEVALHSSLYYLTADPDGPGLRYLSQDDMRPLKKEVFKRYEKILLRDLDPGNRDKRIYRGLARSCINWKRLKKFAEKEELDLSRIKHRAATALVNFLEQEVDDVSSGKRQSCINCGFDELLELATDLGICKKDLPHGTEKLCGENRAK